MKSDELFEMLTEIDEKFIDDALPENRGEAVRAEKIHMTGRRFPWGIVAAACLAVCAAVGTIIAVNMGKGKIPVGPNTSTESGLNALAAECVFDSSDYGQTDDKPYPEIKEMFCEFTMDEYPELTFRVIRLSGGEGGPTLYCVEEGVEYRLLSGHEIFLCDFDSDGKREICANYEIGSGIVHSLIWGYDPEDNTAYQYNTVYHYDSHLNSDNEVQCRLIIVDGVLKVQVSPAWGFWEADDVEVRPLELVKIGTLTVDNSVTEHGDELTIQVKPSKFEYKVGEAIPVDVEITNVSGRPIYLYKGFQAKYNDGTSNEDKYYIVDGNITRNDLSLENKSRPLFANEAIYTLRLEQDETYTARLNFEATAGENTPFGMYQGVIIVTTIYDPQDHGSLTNHTVKFPIRISETGNSSLNTLAAECVFDYLWLEESELPPVEERHYEFTMSEYQDQKFYTEITSLGVELYTIDDGIFHLTHYGLNNLYLYDFDNDGKREICMTYYDNEIPYRRDISVYDPEDRAFYCSDPGYMEFCYRLVVSDGKLKMEVSPSSAMNNVPDSDITTIMPLAVKRIAKDAEEIYTENSGKELPLVFELEEFNGVKTYSGIHISKDSDTSATEYLNVRLTNPATGAIDSHIIMSSIIKQLYAADLNGDGYREIVAAVNDFGKNATGHSAGYYLAFDIVNGKGYQFIDGESSEENRLPYDHLLIKDGSLYMCSYDGSAVDSEPMTIDIMNKVFENVTDPNTSNDPSESTEPEPLFSFFENDKLRLQVELEKSAYKKGDIITVNASVTNKSDKTFYIYPQNATSKTNSEIRTYISLDGRRLYDIDAVPDFTDAERLIPVEPGKSFTLKVRFDTTYTGDEFLGETKQPVQPGTYQGVTTVTIMDSSDFQTPAEDYSANFAISIK